MKRRPFACVLALAIASASAARAESAGLEVMIDRAAAREATARRTQAIGGMVAGATLVVAGKLQFDATDAGDRSSRAAALTLLGLGAVAVGSGPFALFGTSPLERIAEDLRAMPGPPNDPERLARADLLLELVARDERSARDSSAWVSGLFATAFLAFSAAEALDRKTDDATRFVRASTYAAGAAASATTAVVLAKTDGPAAQLAEAWAIARAAGAPCAPEVAERRTSLTVAPFAAGLALAGAF